MNDKIKRDIAKKAATVAGGPLAGKAVDLASKTIPNKNPHDKSEARLSNALNKKNQIPTMGRPSKIIDNSNKFGNNVNQKESDLTNNEGENEVTPSKKVKNMVFGKEKKQENLTGAAQIAKKAKKGLKIIKFIAPIFPALMVFLIIMLAGAIIMSQIMIVRDKVNNALISVTTGVEKYINIMSGNGWATEEELFFKTLESRYNDSLTLPSETGKVLKLDVPLVAATINYSKISNVGLYEDITESNAGKADDDSATGIFGDFFASTINNAQTRNFYYVANDKLGNYRSLLPGNRQLLGHMIGYKIIWKDVSYIDNPGEIFAKWSELAKYFLESIPADYEEIFNVKFSMLSLIPGIGTVQQLYGFMKTFKEMLAYESMGDNHDSYMEYHWRVFKYELDELIFNSKRFFESDVSNNMGEDENLFESILKELTTVATPYVTFYETLDENLIYNYGDFLRRAYFPGTFFSRGNVTEAKLDSMVSEVFQQREYYEYLVGDLGAPDACSTGSFGGSDCGYDLSVVYAEGRTYKNDDPAYKSVKNIKVNLVSYYQDRGASVIDTDIPFEKYILGVVRAEVDNVHEEAQKAQAVAARSFALARPFGMGQIEYCNLKKNGDGWTLTLRGSTADQVYCDPEKGCHKKTGAGFNGSDMYPGTEGGKKYKDPLPADDPMRSVVASTAGQVTINQDGNVVLANFVNSDQEKWQELAKTRTYMDFLPEYYTNKVGNGQKISIGEGNCSEGGNVSSNNCVPNGGSTGAQAGEWSSWRQMDAQWKDISIGGSTIGKIGCAATSVSIQLKRSGVTTTFDPINPGTFVEAYKKVGGFVGEGIVFPSVNKVAPKFKYIDRVYFDKNSNKVDMLSKAVADGCYPVLEVKKGNGTGQHWVAVVEVKDGVIVMADPASSSTNAIEKYGTGLSQYICYKVEE